MEASAPSGSSRYVPSGQQKLVMVMVGLPGRGKTFISHKLCRYLNWRGYRIKQFNISDYRRQINDSPPPSFFDPANAKGFTERQTAFSLALKDMLQFLADDGEIAILDGSNHTLARRRAISQSWESSDMQGELVFIESVVNQEAILEKNIQEIITSSPDLRNVSPSEAVQQVKERFALYEPNYTSMHDEQLTAQQAFIKITNNGQRVTTSGIRGYLLSKVVCFLLNLSITRSPIYISRHGESQFNRLKLIGGNSPLTERGERYATGLGVWLSEQAELKEAKELSLWSSTLVRTVQTAAGVTRALHLPSVPWRALCEIDAGICDGLTYAEIKKRWPEEFEARRRDKLHYRYPRGESYLDIIERLEPVIFELERLQHPVIVVGHQAVLRCLYAYFWGENTPQMSDIPYTDLPLHTVIKLSPKAYVCQVERFELEGTKYMPSNPEDPPADEADPVNARGCPSATVSASIKTPEQERKLNHKTDTSKL